MSTSTSKKSLCSEARAIWSGRQRDMFFVKTDVHLSLQNVRAFWGCDLSGRVRDMFIIKIDVHLKLQKVRSLWGSCHI